MVLSDYVRNRSREPLDAIRELDRLTEQHRRDRAAAEQRARRDRDEADRLRAVLEERNASRKQFETMANEVRQQISLLETRLKEREAELGKASDLVKETENLIAQQRRSAEIEYSTAQGLIQELAKCEQERARQQRRLAEARRSALNECLGDQWARMVELTRSQEHRLHLIAARNALDAARHDDPEVSALYEARTEWKRILASPVPSLVMNSARAELERVESELDKRFPGCLALDPKAVSVDEIEELFFSISEPGLETVSLVHLPFGGDTWDSVSRGDGDPRAHLAVRMAWALITTLGLSSDNAEFVREGARCVVRVNRNLARVTDTVTLPLPQGGTVSFIMNPLPNEVREAFNDEDTAP